MDSIEKMRIAYASYIKASGDAAANGDKSMTKYYFMRAQETAAQIEEMGKRNEAGSR